MVWGGDCVLMVTRRVRLQDKASAAGSSHMPPPFCISESLQFYWSRRTICIAHCPDSVQLLQRTIPNLLGVHCHSHTHSHSHTRTHAHARMCTSQHRARGTLPTITCVSPLSIPIPTALGAFLTSCWHVALYVPITTSPILTTLWRRSFHKCVEMARHNISFHPGLLVQNLPLCPHNEASSRNNPPAFPFSSAAPVPALPRNNLLFANISPNISSRFAHSQLFSRILSLSSLLFVVITVVPGPMQFLSTYFSHSAFETVPQLIPLFCYLLCIKQNRNPVHFLYSYSVRLNIFLNVSTSCTLPKQTPVRSSSLSIFRSISSPLEHPCSSEASPPP